MTTQAALRTSDFINTIGVNTHIDQFPQYGYGNLAVTEASINYLGLKNIRDSAQNGYTWQQVALATGAKFCALINEEAPSQMQGDLNNIVALAKLGIISYVEGGNEE